VATWQNMREFESADWEAAYGIENSGAVLVRPDGYVAARFSSAVTDPRQTLHSALDAILAR